MFFEEILVVDDDDRIIKSLQIALSKYELRCFHRGEDALVFLKKSNNIRLAIIDVCMQGMDGISLLNEIKKTHPGMQVIVMTGYASKEVLLGALHGHADAFLEKPFKVSDLREKVETRVRSEERPQTWDGEAVRKMMDFVQKNVSDVSLEGLAGEFCLNSKYMSRLFKKMGHCGFREFKIRVRLERARELLAATQLPVYRIAVDLGYQNPETFMRMFKRRTGSTPLEYRESLKR